MPNITQIPAPRVPLIEANSGLISTQWFRYFNNINTIVGGGTGVTPPQSGGTGTSDVPVNGQILIGNNTGTYTVAYLTAGTGLFSTTASGALTVGISNTGVTAGAYGSASAVSTFTVNAQGQITLASTTSISISTSQITSGLLAIVRGGTNSLATPINGGISYGTGTAYAFSAAGTLNQVLLSGGAASPTWASQSTLAVGTATNLAGGAAGSVPYQSALNTTAFLPVATNGQVLTLAAGVPSWATPTTGTVTSVTGTAPVVSSGGNTPAISMAAATTSIDGYLKAVDWTTFNNKGSGTVTSVSALTLGTTGTDLSSSVATGTTTPVITLNVPTASAANRGALSAADWTTFNNKGTVTSVSFTGGILSVATATTTPAFTVAGTSGGIPYFSSATTWATSAALAANALVVGGGAGAAPATITTGTGVVTALGVATGSAGAFVVNGGALGTPSSGTVTNLTGTASININGTVGGTTPAAGSFTSLTATSVGVGGVLAKTGGKTSVTAVAGSLTLATGGVTLATQVMAATATWRVVAYGTYAASSSAVVRNFTMSCFWGATALTAVTTGNVLASTAQTTPWKVELEITGSSATAAWCTAVLSAQVSSTIIPLNFVATAASVTSLTTTSTLDFRVGQTGTAVAGDTINVHSVTIERIV